MFSNFYRPHHFYYSVYSGELSYYIMYNYFFIS